MESGDKTKIDHSDQIESNSVTFVSTKSSLWPIALGSLDDTVTCESSLSPADADPNSVNPNQPLVLNRPSIDCGPCEIKISFEQKHEIRQVYVRSTARVYEIYCAADKQSMNEYLCTVRCGMAEKPESEEYLDKEYLQNSDAVTSISPTSNGSANLVEEGVHKTESSGNTNEDGWVEIKDPDSSLTDDGDSSRSKQIDIPIEPENQDLYEATAEISDTNPCTSMTIRLLSHQSRELVYVDEVYVFADPVECDDISSSTTNGVGGPNGSSLMTMLVPTLLQLSKSRMSQLGERQQESVSKLKSADQVVSQDISPASTFARIQQGEIPSVSSEQEMAAIRLKCPDKLTSLEASTQTLNIEDTSSTTSGLNVSSYHIGKTLEQLVSRIARIEEFCLSFEEKMINPIISMDTRLGKVEQQLVLLNDKFQVSQTHSPGTHVPDLSRNSSELNSVHIDGNTIPPCKAGSLEKVDCLSCEGPVVLSSDKPIARDASLVPIIIAAPEFSLSSAPLEKDDGLSEKDANLESDNLSTARARAHLVPSLVITAPEFSFVDDEEEHGMSNSVGGSPDNKLKKKPRSIDDALAFALAGFLSSTSTYEPTSDFEPDTSKADYANELDELAVGTSSEVVAVDEVLGVPPFGSYSESTVEIVAGHDYAFGEESAGSVLVQDVDNHTAQAEKTVAEADTVIAEEVETDSTEKHASKASSEIANKVDTSGETVMNGASDVLHGILDLPNSSVVNYKIPILDVKFASRESSNISTSIEALLTETREIDVGSPSVQEKDGGGGDITDQNSATEPTNIEVTALEASDHLLVDLGHDDSIYLSLDSKGLPNLPHESYDSCNQDMCVALL